MTVSLSKSAGNRVSSGSQISAANQPDAFTDYGENFKVVFYNQWRIQEGDTLGTLPLRQLQMCRLVPKHRRDLGFTGAEDASQSS